ncbi:MAG: hypothetical protein ACQKBV_11305 [Puniceicoccales bacterium]
MDFIDIVVPIIVFIVWLVGQLGGALSKKNQDEAQEDQQRPFTPLNDPSNDDDARTRRIQEEIRRKIAERRGQSPDQDQQPAPPPLRREAPAAPPPLRREPARGNYDTTWGEESAYSTGETRRDESPSFAPSAPARDYAAELEEQRRRREETERAAQRARQRVGNQMQSMLGGEIGSRSRRRSSSHSGTALSRRVRNQLTDPRAAREAFVYMEILGTPVGQRHNGQSRPSWEG